MDRKTPQNNFLEIRDLAIASFLYSSEGVTLIGKQRLPDGKVAFLFSPRQQAETLVSQYWRLEAPPVQAKRLFSAQRDLKDQIFAG